MPQHSGKAHDYTIVIAIVHGLERKEIVLKLTLISMEEFCTFVRHHSSL